MLAHAEDPAARIQRAIADVAPGPSTPDAWIGRRIGPYRILREIGRGGMGVVFEAERDTEYRKRVALKIAPSAAVMAPLDARFRLERQILAALEHPNIARLLDGGTANGIPYFVMEYVEGVPVTEYCALGSLVLRDRVAIVRQVCDALRHAHESLVVHRDLKPTNILVTQDGVPTLLDFGIAKILDPLAEPGSTLGFVTWTPDYASPEQVAGRAISTRTDVYSLGLVLYEILTGERAQVADTSSPMALQRSVCEREPMCASERVAAAGHQALARQLRGDLDTIVSMAIRKDPERRYASVAALDDDLGRWLDGRPILARPQTWAYRAGKLLHRHRVGAVAAVLLLLSVAGGLVGTIYQARRAEWRFQQVRALANAFVFDVHDRIETLPGSTDARKSIVQTALIYLENLRVDAGDDPALANELAAAYEKVGTVQGDPLASNLGDADGAIASYRRAEEILAPLERRGNREARLRIAAISRKTGHIRRAQGQVDGAMQAYGRARDLGEQLVADAPADIAVLTLLGEVYSDIGRASMELRDHAVAEHAARRAMELTERLVALEPANRDHRDGLATAYNVLGSVHIVTGRLDDAAASFRRAVETRESLVRDEPMNVELRRTLMVSYGNLGDVLGYRLGESLGDRSGAADAFLKAAGMAEATRQADPSDRRAMFDVVNAKLRLGSVLAGEPTRLADALRELEDANRLNTELLAEEPASARYGYVALVLHRRLGETLIAMRRDALGAESLEWVRAAAPRLLDGPNGPNARLQLVMASLRLAALRAREAGGRARALADFVAQELASKPIGPPSVAAEVDAELDRVRQQIASHHH